MLVAVTRGVSASLGACELTHLSRTPIDLDLACAQHAVYGAALERAGCRVIRLPTLDECPDAVFVEDVAVVLDEIAIVTRPGAESRRGEVASVARELEAYRPVRCIEPPGTLDGGDVLRLGRRIFVGLSGRTNAAGVEQLRSLAEPHSYTVTGVPVTGCLHLKSAVTEVAPGVILVNRQWVDAAPFGDVEVIDVDPSEPYAVNGLLIAAAPFVPTLAGSPASSALHPSRVLSPDSPPLLRPTNEPTAEGLPPRRAPVRRHPLGVPPPVHADRGASRPTLIYPASFPRTQAMLESQGIRIETVDVSELQKAEGAVTCCSLVFEA